MRFLQAVTIFTILFSSAFLFSDHVNAQFYSPGNARLNSPTGYYPYTIARPQDRAWIRSLPIEQRPTRPLHFYGNRVRQTYTVGPTNQSVTTSLPIQSSSFNGTFNRSLFSGRRR